MDFVNDMKKVADEFVKLLVRVTIAFYCREVCISWVT